MSNIFWTPIQKRNLQITREEHKLRLHSKQVPEYGSVWILLTIVKRCMNDRRIVPTRNIGPTNTSMCAVSQITCTHAITYAHTVATHSHTLSAWTVNDFCGEGVQPIVVYLCLYECIHACLSYIHIQYRPSSSVIISFVLCDFSKK